MQIESSALRKNTNIGRVWYAVIRHQFSINNLCIEISTNTIRFLHIQDFYSIKSHAPFFGLFKLIKPNTEHFHITLKNCLIILLVHN